MSNRNKHRSNRNPSNPNPTLWVWYVEPVGKIAEPVTFIADYLANDDPNGNVQVIRGDLATSREIVRDAARQAGAEVYEVEGVEGIAVVDPHWDGKPVAICRNPTCGTLHDAHLMTAENLYARAA